MKFLTIFCVLIGTASASSPYDSFVKNCSEIVGNGDVGQSPYTIGSLDYKYESKSYVKNFEKNKRPIFKRADILSELNMLLKVASDQTSYQFKSCKSTLNKLFTTPGKIVMAFGEGASSTCIESESCTFAGALIYTDDGYRLYIDLDYTD